MVNRANYRLVQDFLDHLRQVLQIGPVSAERYRSYLRHLLLWADAADFAQAHLLRPTLPDYLAALAAAAGAAPRAAATQKKIVQNARRLFTWAKMTFPRPFRELPMAWIEALRPPRTAAEPHGEHVFVTLDEVRQLAAVPNPHADPALLRDQAAAALLYVSGMRVGALATLPLAALDLPARTVKQWPSLGVLTKNRKSATTYLLDLPELLAVVERWDRLVRAQLPPEAMWYTPIIVRWASTSLSPGAPGTGRPIAIAKRLRRQFKLAGLPPRSPHKFRHGHAVWALQHAPTMADYKAVSMNLMHEDVQVTDGIYAPLLGSEVRDRIGRLSDRGLGSEPLETDLVQYLRGLSKGQMSKALHILADELAQ